MNLVQDILGIIFSDNNKFFGHSCHSTDLMDMAAGLPSAMQPTAPRMVEKPIGFDLPQEFQDRVRLSEGQSLYPPLNLATARKALIES